MKTSEKAITSMLDKYQANAQKHTELLQVAKDEKAKLRKNAQQFKKDNADHRINSIAETLKEIHEHIEQLTDLLYGVDEYEEIRAQINKLVESRDRLLPSKQMQVEYAATVREIERGE